MADSEGALFRNNIYQGVEIIQSETDHIIDSLSSPWCPLIPHPAFANVHQVRLVSLETRKGEN
jgi:hypothetical protein